MLGDGTVGGPPGDRRIRSTASGVPTFSASPSSTRCPLPGSIRANFTDELPEFSTSTKPDATRVMTQACATTGK